MPAKVTLYNLKCEPVFEFGTGPRNAVHYNPTGNILILGGFGNLRGSVEVWDAPQRKLVTKLEAPDTTLLEWSPDGMHFMTATTAPRLRQGNGYVFQICLSQICVIISLLFIIFLTPVYS